MNILDIIIMSKFVRGDFMKREVSLSPPWIILLQQLRTSIGADPNVCVCPIQQQENVYSINIVAECFNQARAIATILTPQYTFGEIVVNVTVYWSCDLLPVEPFSPPSEQFDELVLFTNRVINTALTTNPFFVESKIIPQDGSFPPSFGNISVIFAKAVLQYFSDDISNIFQYSNQVAQDVFEAVMNKGYFDKTLISFATIISDCTTTTKRCDSGEGII